MQPSPCGAAHHEEEIRVSSHTFCRLQDSCVEQWAASQASAFLRAHFAGPVTRGVEALRLTAAGGEALVFLEPDCADAPITLSQGVLARAPEDISTVTTVPANPSQSRRAPRLRPRKEQID